MKLKYLIVIGLISAALIYGFKQQEEDTADVLFLKTYSSINSSIYVSNSEVVVEKIEVRKEKGIYYSDTQQKILAATIKKYLKKGYSVSASHSDSDMSTVVIIMSKH